MLSKDMNKTLDECWKNTSDTVRHWLDERRAAEKHGNPWAEQQLKAFVKHYRQSGSGVRTYHWMVGEHEQLELE